MSRTMVVTQTILSPGCTPLMLLSHITVIEEQTSLDYAAYIKPKVEVST